jgi:hypothetical protein
VLVQLAATVIHDPGGDTGSQRQMSLMNLKPHAASAILTLVTFQLSACARVEKETSTVAVGEFEQVARAYKIKIVAMEPAFPVKTWHGKIDGTSADGKTLANYAGLFAAEFSLYPPDLVKRTRLARVVLCADLSFAGQRRNAIPDYEHDTLYLDVSRGAHNKAYLRTVVHHEFFHIIDYRDDGSVYTDERWAALNPAKFKYGTGGRNAQDVQTTSVLTDKFPGFLTHYSTTAVEEDKAEVFAHMIVDSDYVEERVKKDRVIKAKVARMRELLIKFCPDMNEKFWEKVRRMKRISQVDNHPR